MLNRPPMLDRRRLLMTAAAAPLVWLMRPRSAAAATAAAPPPFRIATDITLADLTAAATLSVPAGLAATDRLQLLDLAWIAHGSRAEIVADPGTGAMKLRLAWPAGRRARVAAIVQTVAAPDPMPDRARHLQQYIDRMALAAAVEPPLPHLGTLRTTITPPPTPPEPAKHHRPAKPAAAAIRRRPRRAHGSR